MRFATLVALAVVVSSTPGLAAPAPFAPNRAKAGPHHAHPEDHKVHARAADHPSHPGHSGPHHAHPDHAVHARADHPGHPAHSGPHHAHPDHAVHARADHPGHPAHPGPHHSHPGHGAQPRAVSSDILQVIESAFDSLPLARKRDVITSLKRDLSSDDYQGLLESLGLSGSGSTVDKRFKLPEISPSTESAIANAANVATIGGGIAKIWDAIDGSGSSSKRDETQFDERAFKIPANAVSWLKNLGNVASIGAGGAAIVGALDGGNSTLKREFVESDERAFKIPANAVSWLKNLGNVASIGAGGAAIVGALDGGNSTLKREFVEADERALKIPADVASWLKTLGNVASIGAGGAAVVGAVDSSSSSTKRELETDAYGIGLERPHFVETVPTFDERALKIPAGVTTGLKNLGNIFSIGAGGAAVVGALDGGSNSTLRRELDETSGEVDLTTLLNGVTPQFEDRSVSSSEVSGLESVLGKVATGASVAGTLATVWSALHPSSSTGATSKRDIDSIFSDIEDTDSSVVSERSIVSSAEGVLAQLLGGILGGSGGISIKRSTYDSDPSIADVLTPEEMQQVLNQLKAQMVDLD